MRTSIKPFTKIISFKANNADTYQGSRQSVVLRDSAGVGLKCNYIYVEASGSAENYFAVELPLGGGEMSGIGGYHLSGSTEGNHLSNQDIMNGSGLVGGAAPINKGVVEVSLNPNEMVSSINIWNNDYTAPSLFFVTYGVMQPVQPVADVNKDVVRGT